ncbi:cysteine-rich receptor-like protein kinase 10 [Phragmites australis]|uniref:cysteine-rich receptor-like protein kinase 10 n=1 Tax=Phragmites australis TaxID=29695 RepID=UPI002D78E632|nr:cysteine-rich receptor-like protein kinase 10 [Phragmites australis]
MAGVLLIILGFLLMPPSAAAVEQVCGNAGNYTANGTYQSNLAFLANTLPINASYSPQLFATATATATAGQSPDVVYTLALCRGDITIVTACSMQRMCPFDKGAAVYKLTTENAADGPTMLDVVAMLSSKTKILAEPKHPAYFNVRVGNEEALSTATKSCSINDMTISVTTAFALEETAGKRYWHY